MKKNEYSKKRCLNSWAYWSLMIWKKKDITFFSVYISFIFTKIQIHFQEKRDFTIFFFSVSKNSSPENSYFGINI